jgi:MarR family transcriptional regulator, negative regulator of the multidrug operon emrRAB
MHIPDARCANLLGAACVSVSEAVTDAVERAVGVGGALPAALITIDAYPHRSIEELRTALGISQPGTVRLVDRLEREGWAQRKAGDGRAVAVTLTPSGRRVVKRLLAARDEALAGALEPLGVAERRQLMPILEKLLAAQTRERRDLEHICRLCHRSSCESCPVAGALY